jgi:hypothetical protein
MRLKTITFLVVLLIICIPGAFALSAGICATAHVTSIEPSSVEADEDFTVGIQIDNCGEDLAKNITFEITRYSQDIVIKEPLMNYIGEMGYANNNRFIVYHMHSSPDATPGEHVFETKLSYGNKNSSIDKRDSFSITINSKEPDLAISRVATEPEIPTQNDKLILTIDIENAGEGDAKDVRVNLKNLDLSGVKSTYLGKISSGENIPARFILESNEAKIYPMDIEIQYKSHGKIKTNTFPLEVQVFSKESSRYPFYMVGSFILGALVIFGYMKLNPSK